MRQGFARFLLIFAAFLLPLQAVAGIAMQYGHGGASMSGEAGGGAVDAHCPFHDADAVPAQPDQAAGNSDSACDNCGVCHLACAGYVPAAEIRSVASPGAGGYASGPLAAMPSRSPEPPQHPPKHSA